MGAMPGNATPPIRHHRPLVATIIAVNRGKPKCSIVVNPPVELELPSGNLLHSHEKSLIYSGKSWYDSKAKCSMVLVYLPT
jgi:hypothetical protein